MNKVTNDIYHTRVSHGVALAWVNSYSAVVVKTSDATMLFDPVGMEVPADSPLDLIVVSHGHSDHWEPKLVARIQASTGATVAAPPALAERLRVGGTKSPLAPPLERGETRHSDVGSIGAGTFQGQNPPFDIVSMVPGEEIPIGGTTLTALRCDHAAVEPLAFQVHSPDGVTVYLPGDTTPFPEMGHLPHIYSAETLHKQDSAETFHNHSHESGVDVLCWMGTALTDGAEIAKLVQPKAFLGYAIAPPAAGERAYGILTRLTPDIPFQALDRRQVFLWPGD